MQIALERAKVKNPLAVARDGREAIAYLKGDGKFANRQEYPLPALVLLDLRLPQVPGLEVLKWIREQPAFAASPGHRLVHLQPGFRRGKGLPFGGQRLCRQTGLPVRTPGNRPPHQTILARHEWASPGLPGLVIHYCPAPRAKSPRSLTRSVSASRVDNKSAGCMMAATMLQP